MHDWLEFIQHFFWIYSGNHFVWNVCNLTLCYIDVYMYQLEMTLSFGVINYTNDVIMILKKVSFILYGYKCLDFFPFFIQRRSKKISFSPFSRVRYLVWSGSWTAHSFYIYFWLVLSFFLSPVQMDTQFEVGKRKWEYEHITTSFQNGIDVFFVSMLKAILIQFFFLVYVCIHWFPFFLCVSLFDKDEEPCQC